MTDFKNEYEASLDDALRYLRRLKRITDPLRYTASLHGSTLLRGKGHDIDIAVQAAGPEPYIPAFLVADKVLKRQVQRLHSYEEHEYNRTMTDIYMSFITRDSLFIDLHIKGWA